MPGSPTDRWYTQTHEWHKPSPNGEEVVIGVSRFAVDELTDITYVDVRKKTGPIKAGEGFGEIESVKATSELYCGIDGVVIAHNQAVIADPSLINQDPWEKGWLIKVKPSDPNQVKKLMSAQDYEKGHH